MNPNWDSELAENEGLLSALGRRLLNPLVKGSGRRNGIAGQGEPLGSESSGGVGPQRILAASDSGWREPCLKVAKEQKLGY